MKEYATLLLLVSAIAAVATLLLPEKNKKLRRSVEFALSLFVLATLASPLAALGSLDIGGLSLRYPTLDLSGDEYSEELLSEMETAVGAGIARDLAARYGVGEADIAAAPTLTLADAELSISALSLTFYGTAATLDLVAVRSYAQKNYTPSCEVYIGER